MDAALLKEIERLSGAIDQAKAASTYHPPRYKPYARIHPHRKTFPPQTRDVVINGASYESSNRKLTRKGLQPASTSTFAPTATISDPHKPIPSTSATAALRPYSATAKSRVVTKRRFQPRNMVLDNIKGTRTGGKPPKPKKQCKFFTMTGLCQRGRTCPYAHNPEKVAICPRFLTRDCPNSASDCPLSHQSTPERVPLCTYFANAGRCREGESCLYPHIRVGRREGICRDFAVLGYCEKGADCDKQHVHECPDFADKGHCPNRKCKLPHVIRANRKRQSNSTGSALTTKDNTSTDSAAAALPEPRIASGNGQEQEFIPLTFLESSEDEQSDADDTEGEDATDEERNE